MRLKRIAMPALVGGFAIVSGFVAMPLMASSEEIEINYVPLDGAAVEATNGWQWHPPMIDPAALPVSLQVSEVGPATAHAGVITSEHMATRQWLEDELSAASC